MAWAALHAGLLAAAAEDSVIALHNTSTTVEVGRRDLATAFVPASAVLRDDHEPTFLPGAGAACPPDLSALDP